MVVQPALPTLTAQSSDVSSCCKNCVTELINSLSLLFDTCVLLLLQMIYADFLTFFFGGGGGAKKMSNFITF
jgi:hypothetical protein